MHFFNIVFYCKSNQVTECSNTAYNVRSATLDKGSGDQQIIINECLLSPWWFPYVNELLRKYRNCYGNLWPGLDWEKY